MHLQGGGTRAEERDPALVEKPTGEWERSWKRPPLPLEVCYLKGQEKTFKVALERSKPEKTESSLLLRTARPESSDSTASTTHACLCPPTVLGVICPREDGRSILYLKTLRKDPSWPPPAPGVFRSLWV